MVTSFFRKKITFVDNREYLYDLSMKKNKLDSNDSIEPFNGILTNQYTEGELFAYLTHFRNRLGKKDDEAVRFYINIIEQEILRRKLSSTER